MSEKFRVIVADPPWAFQDRLPGPSRGAWKNYPCLTTYDICRFAENGHGTVSIMGQPIANDAALYADDVPQLLRYRDDGSFPGYREPDGFTGEAVRIARPGGRVVCQNLGNGAADLLFADYVLRSASSAGDGTELRR